MVPRIGRCGRNRLPIPEPIVPRIGTGGQNKRGWLRYGERTVAEFRVSVFGFVSDFGPSDFGFHPQHSCGLVVPLTFHGHSSFTASAILITNKLTLAHMYFLKRLAFSVPLLLVISFLAFLLV